MSGISKKNFNGQKTFLKSLIKYSFVKYKKDILEMF